MSRRFAWRTRSFRPRRAAVLLASTLAVAFALSLLFDGLFERWDQQISDRYFLLRYRLLGPQEISPRLVHVVISDSSLRALGVPQWDRKMQGRLIHLLQETNTRLLACDILFEFPSADGHDRLLVDAVGGPRPVFLPLVVCPPPTAATQPTVRQDDQQQQVLDRVAIHPLISAEGDPPSGTQVIVPFNGLSSTAAGLGHINAEPDDDGVIRRLPLLYRWGDRYVPALTLRVLMELFEVDAGNIEVAFGRHMILRDARVREDLTMDVEIPVDRRGRIIVDFAGPWEDSHLDFPADRLLAAGEDALTRAQLHDLVDGTLTFISDISTANRDYGRGIFDSPYPLSGVHLNVVNSILTGNMLRQETQLGSVLLLLLFAAVLWLGAARFDTFGFAALCAGAYIAYLALHFWMFADLGILPRLALPTTVFGAALVAVSVDRSLLTRRERDVLKARLSTATKLETMNRQLVRRHGELEAANQRLRALVESAGLSEGSGPTDGSPAGDPGDIEQPEPRRERLAHPEAFAPIITGDAGIQAVFRYVESIAASANPVLITGESGVGKELVARAIHEVSGRAGKFVSENVAGLDDTMFTDTLFGHVRGAFTDAESVRKGLVEEARGGTLFLDEIGDLSLSSQVKLLRFIEEHEYRPLGGDEVKNAEVRVIVATNANLKKKLEEGSFREDLYFRLTYQVSIPPLRERQDDLPRLLEHFAAQTADSLGTRKPVIPPQLVNLLRSYRFPGNVRELRNMVENAMSRAGSGRMSLSYFREYIKQDPDGFGRCNGSIGVEGGGIMFSGRLPSLNELEDSLLREAVKRTGGNQSLAARLLGLSPSALSRRLHKQRDEKRS
ncbi:MAG: sigma 54-interacting transcriptional regulator [Spirochaetales bacterium]|nr:sigma 54-interacting transcriptional regulator [Spirochaetales bacterium]